MGLSLSSCVNLEAEEDLLREEFRVVRTNEEEQGGWMLTKKLHRCSAMAGSKERPRAHAVLQEAGWRVHLHNGDEEDEDPGRHACGWRRLGTFWPARLTGDSEAISLWTERLRERLEELAGQQGLPDRWVQHSCCRGAFSGVCDGCCAEQRAKEKKMLLDALAAAARAEARREEAENCE